MSLQEVESSDASTSQVLADESWPLYSAGQSQRFRRKQMLHRESSQHLHVLAALSTTSGQSNLTQGSIAAMQFVLSHLPDGTNMQHI